MRKKLIGLGIVLVVIIVIGIIFFNLPQRIGLAQSPAEKLLSNTPDRETADAMMEDLKTVGIDTTGLDIYVIPYKESGESLAIAVLDSSQGFDISNFSREDAITEYLELLAKLDEDGEYGIKRVAVDYRNEDGESLLALTVPTDTISRYANGTISRQQFLQELEGQVNFVELAKIFVEKAQ